MVNDIVNNYANTEGESTTSPRVEKKKNNKKTARSDGCDDLSADSTPRKNRPTSNAAKRKKPN